jgi:ubiquinone/menaquinone biosynthesis C-methylase UbiE
MARERAYELRHISRLEQSYLDTDILLKIAQDDGYRKKVELIERALAGAEGWILDVGAGTCGEDEYLGTRGLKLVCVDVNDLALSISRRRSRRFKHNNLEYVTCDGERLPFADNVISFVIYNESLHHLQNPTLGLREASRVLKPGGRVFMFEPYAYDPWRRISEVRDRFKGTIETSFSVRQLNTMLEAVGMHVLRVERPVYISYTKLARLNLAHRWARRAYHAVSEALPSVFGMIWLVAQKGAVAL